LPTPGIPYPLANLLATLKLKFGLHHTFPHSRLSGEIAEAHSL
jgi:hypothetical protein